jgi:hypothetical protein
MCARRQRPTLGGERDVDSLGVRRDLFIQDGVVIIQADVQKNSFVAAVDAATPPA